jgi:hypothetical protein
MTRADFYVLELGESPSAAQIQTGSANLVGVGKLPSKLEVANLMAGAAASQR